MDENEPQVLMVFRRDILYRTLFYLVPFFFGLAGYSIVRDTVSGKIADLGPRLFTGLWAVFVAYGVWHMLTRWVLDFKCTQAGIEITTVIGGRAKIEWGSLRRFSRSRLRVPCAGSGWLVSEGHPRFFLVNMSSRPMDRLEELVRSQSNAEVRGGL